VSKVEKENVIVRISHRNFIACDKNQIDMTMKMKFAINMHSQILNTISSQCKKISESVLIIQNLLLPGKKDDFNFSEITRHIIC
jgi:hypothetical protein